MACMHAKLLLLCLTLYGLYPTRLLCLWDSLGKNTGVGCCALLQGIFPAQGSSPVSHIAGGFYSQILILKGE